METAEKIRVLSSLIDASQRIVISTHTHPDGDALGSSAALYHYLRTVRGKECVCVVREPAPETIAFIGGDVLVLGPEAIAAADLIISTDYNGFSRAGQALELELRESRAKKVLIDHHLTLRSLSSISSSAVRRSPPPARWSTKSSARCRE